MNYRPLDAKFEIKSRLNGSVLFSVETESLKLCLEAAVKSGANLAYADLAKANLVGANLTGAKGIKKQPIQILGHKHYIQTTQDGKLRIGCEEHTFGEWREIAEDLGTQNGYSALDVEIYKLHIEHAERISKLLWDKKEAH